MKIWKGKEILFMECYKLSNTFDWKYETTFNEIRILSKLRSMEQELKYFVSHKLLSDNITIHFFDSSLGDAILCNLLKKKKQFEQNEKKDLLDCNGKYWIVLNSDLKIYPILLRET